jgi:hypothetical protein
VAEALTEKPKLEIIEDSRDGTAREGTVLGGTVRIGV